MKAFMKSNVASVANGNTAAATLWVELGLTAESSTTSTTSSMGAV